MYTHVVRLKAIENYRLKIGQIRNALVCRR